MKEEIINIALICVRGGSKGIPNKNIRIFHKKPLLGWTLEAVINSMVFDRIIVSTDSEKIAEIALKFGAEVPGLRPDYLSKDISDQFETHNYIFTRLNLTDANTRVAIIMNNPFITANFISEMMEKAVSINFERIVSNAIEVRHPFFYQFRFAKGLCVPIFPKEYIQDQINRQNRDVFYVPYFLHSIGKPSFFKSWKAYKETMAKGFIPVFLKKNEAFDLDDEIDWSIAESVFLKK